MNFVKLQSTNMVRERFKFYLKSA